MFIRRKKNPLLVYRQHGWTQRVAPLGQFKSLTWGISLGFPLASRLALPGSESCLVHLRVLPCVHLHVLAKVDSSEEAYGKVHITYYVVVSPPYLTSE